MPACVRLAALTGRIGRYVSDNDAQMRLLWMSPWEIELKQRYWDDPQGVLIAGILGKRLRFVEHEFREMQKNSMARMENFRLAFQTRLQAIPPLSCHSWPNIEKELDKQRQKSLFNGISVDQNTFKFSNGHATQCIVHIKDKPEKGSGVFERGGRFRTTPDAYTNGMRMLPWNPLPRSGDGGWPAPHNKMRA
jgi:hypothetical protein